MNRSEIKYVMAIIRPAIWALYGREKLEMTGYSKIQIKCDTFDQVRSITGCFEAEGEYNGKPRFFKIRIEKDIVTHLAVGELNV